MYMTKLMQQLCRPESLREITPRSLQDYTMGWRRAWETTASSMLGIHFGHYMAGTFNPDIVLFNATMADLPMKTGYSPRHWQEGLNIILEKIPGNFNVEKLQIILLFEADFNTNNKWLARAIMLNTEMLDLLADKWCSNVETKACSMAYSDNRKDRQHYAQMT